MQRRRGVCASSSTAWGLFLAGSTFRLLTVAFLIAALVLSWAANSSAQVNTATLSGAITDAQNLSVKGAKITLTNAGTGAQRTAASDDAGRYNVVGLPPGRYKMSVDGGSNFALYENDSVVLTVGESASLDLRLDLKGRQESGVTIFRLKSESPALPSSIHQEERCT